MRLSLITSFGVALVVVTTAGLIAQPRSSDLHLDVAGVETSGDPATIGCDLDFVEVPSNLFAGTCRVTLGHDHLVLVGGDRDRQRMPTMVLNGGITIRGLAETGTGRFASLVDHGRLGFPLYIEIDPLRREWTIRGDVPPGEPTMSASGRLTSGRIVFRIP